MTDIIVWDISGITTASNAFGSSSTPEGPEIADSTFTMSASGGQTISYTDEAADGDFSDGHSDQRTDDSITINGVTYPADTRIEPKYGYEVYPEGGDPADSFFVYAIRLDGSGDIVGLASEQPLDPGATYVFTGVSVDNPVIPDGDLVCFALGTLIATPCGEVAVETLRIGDLVLTADGRAVPVLWIGRQTRHRALAWLERMTPVRVLTGALGCGMPHTDLVLTADHALIVDGLAINASALVNGTTIVFDPVENLPSSVSFYHVETEAHDVILANGVTAETFVDYVGRRAFDNYREYFDLYGSERIIREMVHPRISASRQVPHTIRERLGIPSFGDQVDRDAGHFLRQLSVG